MVFTPPKYFNDVNEMTPTFATEINNDIFFKHIYNEESVSRIYDYAPNLQKETTFKEFYISLKQNERDRDYFMDSILHSNTESIPLFRHKISEYVSVLCLSRLNDSPLMWAHYTDSHKGICLGIDFSNSEIQIIESKDVDYNEDKIVLPSYFSRLDDDESERCLMDVSYRKDILWKYEEEYRILVNSERHCKTKKDGNKTILFQELDLKHVTQIYLGCQHADDGTLNTIVKEQEISPEIYKMKQDNNTFKLIPELYTPKD